MPPREPDEARWTARDGAIAAGLAVLGALLAGCYLAAFAPDVSPWHGDSPRYIEAARSLLRGEALLVRAEYAVIRPIDLWPPGYPILVAAVSMAGMDVLRAGMLLTCASVAALAPAVFWAFAVALGRPMALAAAWLCVTSLGILSFANSFGTEPFFLLLAVLALGCMARARFVAAGLLVGLSLAVRHTGLTLLPALCVALLLSGDPAGVRRQAGLAGPVVALLAWSTWAHGTPTPYAMPASTRSLAQVLTDMGQTLTLAAIPSVTVAEVVPWWLSLGGVMAVILAALAVALLVAAEPDDRRRGAGAAATFVLAEIAITVLGRLRYEWGGEIDVRHASQVEWLVLPLATLVAMAAWPRMRHRAVPVCCILAALLVGVRLWGVVDRQAMLDQTRPLVARAVATGAIPPDAAARHIKTGQFLRLYEADPGLHALAVLAARNCALVSNIADALVTRYDILALQLSARVPPGVDMVWIQALLPPKDARPDPVRGPDLHRVDVPRLPGGLAVYTSDAGRCLPRTSAPGG